MSADAISTCPQCLERQLREYHDLFCVDANGDIVLDDEDPPVRPVRYVVSIELHCRACGYKHELSMTSPL